MLRMSRSRDLRRFQDQGFLGKFGLAYHLLQKICIDTDTLKRDHAG
jgi:hypothetical protein